MRILGSMVLGRAQLCFVRRKIPRCFLPGVRRHSLSRRQPCMAFADGRVPVPRVRLLRLKLSELPFTVQHHVQYMLQKPQPDWKAFAPFFHPARTPSPLNKLTFPTTKWPPLPTLGSSRETCLSLATTFKSTQSMRRCARVYRTMW